MWSRGVVFWQLTIGANGPALLARFRAQALGYQPAPPTEPDTPWNRHYRARAASSESAEHCSGRCGGRRG